MAEQYPVNIVFDAVDQVTGSMRRINSRIERMTGPFRRLNNRLRAMDRASGFMRLRESIGRVGSATGRVVRQFGALATKIGAIGGLAATMLGRLVGGVARTGDDVAKTARSIGISAQFLQEYRFAAERLGVSQRTLDSSVVAFSKRLGEMRSGYGRLRTLLEKSDRDLLAQLDVTQSTEEAFGLLMSAIEKMEDPSKRTALAAAAFSRQGVRLTNIAIAGSKEVDRLRRRAHELGLVLDDEALAASERYQDSLTNMQSAMQGLRNIIGASLMPVFADLMDRMTVFFVNNRDEVTNLVKDYTSRIPGAVEELWHGVVQLLDRLEPLARALQWMFDTFGTGETILGGLALVMGGPLILSITALVLKIVTFVALLAGTPIGWFLGGAAAIAAAIWGASKAVDYVRDNWPGVWRTISNVIGGVIDSFALIGDLLTGNFDGLMERLRRISGAVERLVPDWLSDDVSGPDVTVRDERRGPAAAAVERAGPELLDRRQILHRSNRIEVEVSNPPPGTRVERDGDDENVVVGARRALAR